MSNHWLEREVSVIQRKKWGQGFDFCFVCGRRENELGVGPLETHEIARGVHRSKAIFEPAAWLRVCRECHTDKLDGMPIVEQLALKAANDFDNFSAVAVNRLRGRQDDAITDADIKNAAESMGIVLNYCIDGDTIRIVQGLSPLDYSNHLKLGKEFYCG